MASLNDELHDAISSAIVQLCRNLLTFHSFVKISGSITFAVDGDQEVNVVLVEQTVSSDAADEHRDKVDVDKCCSVQQKATVIKRRRGRPRGKSLPVFKKLLQIIMIMSTKDGRQKTSNVYASVKRAPADCKDAHNDDAADADQGGRTTSCAKSAFESAAFLPEEEALVTENHLRTPGDEAETENIVEQLTGEMKVELIVEDRQSTAETVKRFSCEDCDFATDHSGHYRRHVVRHHDANTTPPVKCSQCGKEFSSTDDLNYHMKKLHNNFTEGTAPCPGCEERFESTEELEAHLSVDHGALAIVPCQSCSQRFLSAEDLKQHVDSVHSNNCSVCGKVFADSEILRSHVDTVHSKSRLTCSVCGHQSATHRGLQRHVAGHEGAAVPRVACDACDKTFTSASTLYHHKRAIHGSQKPYECQQCGARFNFNHSLKLHVLKHAGHRPHQCTTCGKSYLTASHLKYHIEAIHSVSKRFICNICHKSFPYQTSYKLHRRLHTGERPHSCVDCGKGFVTRGALREHEKTHTAGNSDDERQYRCDVCGRGYRTAALLRAHGRRHTADASRHVCEVCGRTFMYRSNLEVHSSVHTSERAFSCSTCGKCFKTASTLYTHQVVHQVETGPSHVCTTCGKSFKTKQRLRAHETRHSGAKPFVCRSCGGAFPDRGGLAKHLKSVHAARARYGCPSCGKTANRLDNLRVHMRSHGEPCLLTLTAEELTVSAAVDLIFDKQRPAEPSPEVENHRTLSSGGLNSSAATLPAFSFIPSSVAKPEETSETSRLARYSSSGVGGSSGGTGGNVVDVFHDSGAYVQHCLSFVAVPTAEYLTQTDIVTQPMSYINQQH